MNQIMYTHQFSDSYMRKFWRIRAFMNTEARIFFLFIIICWDYLLKFQSRDVRAAAFAPETSIFPSETMLHCTAIAGVTSDVAASPAALRGSTFSNPAPIPPSSRSPTSPRTPATTRHGRRRHHALRRRTRCPSPARGWRTRRLGLRPSRPQLRQLISVAPANRHRWPATASSRSGPPVFFCQQLPPLRQPLRRLAHSMIPLLMTTRPSHRRWGRRSEPSCSSYLRRRAHSRSCCPRREPTSSNRKVRRCGWSMTTSLSLFPTLWCLFSSNLVCERK